MNRAYLAGFFDGEGCVYLLPRGRTIQVSLTQKKPQVLYLVQQEFGGKVTLHSRGCYRWRCNGRPESLKFLRAIRPYSIVKRYDVEVGIAYAKTFRNTCMGSTKLDPNIFKKRVSLATSLGCGTRYAAYHNG